MQSQNNRLLDYLKQHGSIDPLRAWEILGIYRLAARVNELRKLGEDIKTTRIKVHNRWSEEICVALYTYEVKQ
mgnify:CR=1 FL=1